MRLEAFPAAVWKSSLTNQDRQRLEEGVVICKEILHRFGAEEKDMFLGTVIAGHPGGMLPLTEKEAMNYAFRAAA